MKTKSSKTPVINNSLDYKKVMADLEQLMNKGSDKVTETELAWIRSLALTAQAYEKAVYSL